MATSQPERIAAWDFCFCSGLQARLVRVIRKTGSAAAIIFKQTLSSFQSGSLKTFCVWAGAQFAWVDPMLRDVLAHVFLGGGPILTVKGPILGGRP